MQQAYNQLASGSLERNGE